MDWKDLIEGYIQSHARADIYTSLPAVIESVKDFEGKQYVDVAPLIKRLYDDERLQKRATIYNVPIMFPAGGGGYLSFPVEKGDMVLLVFGMRDMDAWRKGDGVVEDTAKTSRTHSLTDAVAIAGLFNENTTPNPSPTDTEWVFKNSKVTQKPDGEVVVNNPAGDLTYKANGDLVHPSGAKITADGDFVTSDGKSLRNHIHDVIITSGSSANTWESQAAK